MESGRDAPWLGNKAGRPWAIPTSWASPFCYSPQVVSTCASWQDAPRLQKASETARGEDGMMESER